MYNVRCAEEIMIRLGIEFLCQFGILHLMLIELIDCSLIARPISCSKMETQIKYMVN